MQIDKLRGEQLDQLFDAMLLLETREECYQFFDDLATMNEISSLAQRLQVAKLLTDGHTYNDIEKNRSEEHTSELQSRGHLVCRLLLEKKKTNRYDYQ